MPSHFSSIGIPLSSQDEFERYARMAIEKGQRIKTGSGTYARFEMGHGAELWGQLNHSNEVIGINPHFTGSAVSTVRLITKVEDPDDNELDGRVYAEAEPGAEGEFTYPFVFDMPDMADCKFSFPEIREVQLAAFAHELSIFRDDKEYDDSQEGETKFAAESFIPSGLFIPDGEQTGPPRAMAVFTGHVLTAGKLKNTYTGGFFYHMKVRTLGGEFDLVADPELVDQEICAGGVVAGSFWLSGRLLKKKKFKLFGR